MSRHSVKLPDLGEGTVAAEIVAWRVQVGDTVEEDQPIAEMSTDKAVVELPSPVRGKVVARKGEPGDVIPVGTELLVFEVDGAAEEASAPAPAPAPAAAGKKTSAPETGAGAARVMASPATRRRAREAGVDLSQLRGSGAGGRIERTDLDAAMQRGNLPAKSAVRTGTEEIKVIGVRRVIAQRMAEAKRSIPHFSYVEEVDITELEALRQYLNSQHDKSTPSLTLLPFVLSALTRVLEDFPNCNALYDAEREVIVRHRAVHAGIATQTRDGLKVPVVRNAESLTLEALAHEIRRAATAARENTAKREQLTGSTITITSLGKLGGIASTPVINAPEVAIIGLNRAVERPMVMQGAVAIRLMMNLSSSFDHRFVDGFDAAAMIQALKDQLEHPATIFIRETSAS